MEKRHKLFSLWKKYYRMNNYYHSYIRKLVLQVIPKDASVLEFSSRGGEILSRLPNKNKLGVEFDEDYIREAEKRNSVKIIRYQDLVHLKTVKFDYILLSNTLSNTKDVQTFINEIKRFTHERTRVVVFYFNFFWKPFFDLGERLGIKFPENIEHNWLSEYDIDNFFYLENFEKVNNSKRFIIPYRIPYISDFINKYISPLPLINQLSLIHYSVFRPIPKPKDYSVSIIIPARNEEGNMRGIFKKIPKLGKKTEIIFVEGHSKDNTYQMIDEEIKKYRGEYKVKLYKQKGKGKGDAVRLGFSKANNDLLMILDADLTVGPEELYKFYHAIKEGKGELVMGSRLIYPMEKQAMRTLNILGNKFFSMAFTFLLDQKIKDTLCGTKVLLKNDYFRIAGNRKTFGDFDPFGDYDLIFGAAKLNFKILEIPIRYKERTYGTTNISRFIHGLLLFKMVYFAAKKMKFI